VVKPITWLGDSLDQVRAFPDDARCGVGFELFEVQKGLDPSDWKPMTVVGAGVKEIRIHTESEYRVMYVAKFSEAIYVLHAFTKKTQQTQKKDIDLASQRYRELVNERK
jgi:phage-related protein